jgi:hypothetical protein
MILNDIDKSNYSGDQSDKEEEEDDDNQVTITQFRALIVYHIILTNSMPRSFEKIYANKIRSIWVLPNQS